MSKAIGILLVVFCLFSCSEPADSVRQVQTSFSETTGLTVTDSEGNSQQLIAESQGVRAVVSPSQEWILVEDMKMSNLVVIRAFHYQGSAYRETALPAIRKHWEMLALKAGVGLEDLERTRVGIGGFSPPGNRVRLEFRADGVQAGEPDLESVLLIDLDQLAE